MASGFPGPNYNSRPLPSRVSEDVSTTYCIRFKRLKCEREEAGGWSLLTSTTPQTSSSLHRKPAATGAPKTKGRKVQGGRVVESRYLQYEKKTKKDLTDLPALGILLCSSSLARASVSAGGKSPEGRKTSTLQKIKEDSLVMGTGGLQSTMLEGHSTAPPCLDLSSIKDTSMSRTAPHLDRTMSRKAEPTSCTTQKKTRLPKKRQDPQETMDMMESQTLLLTLLSVKMENNLALLEEKAEKDLAALCREKERLQQRVLELRRQLLLQQKHQELATILDAQMEVLGPLEAVAKRFKEEYKTLATALDATRHELPVQGIHMQGSGQELLDDLEPALKTTLQLLGKLGISSPDASGQVSRLLEELRDLITKKDRELYRIFDLAMDLSTLASKEAALINQEAWEEAQGTPTCGQWYLGPEAADITTAVNK
ncbi:HAUS augmin-like complex subunit 8 isoform X2 [Alexandromys fortis]|uniref:HAUS augmin-like complex subunit 8 isoform X2 n=1 Tax=Alexandromys fortis TaxID=100897 RepID=UPI002153A536|nr:HAUS augmin-like complex subunit 8 isoform X2 [Microtus fortis]